MAAGILASRLSGLAREASIARFIAAGPVGDALFAALRIPNTLQNLLGEGTLSASFIPVYARLLDEGREEEAGRVAGAIAALLIGVTGVLTVAGVVFAEPITRVVVVGFEAARFELTVRLVRIITPGVGVLVLSAWCLGVLNSHRRFFLSYVAPVLWNAAQIATLWVLGASLSNSDLAVAVAWAILAGGVAQLLVQLPSVIRLTRGLRLVPSVAERATRTVLRNLGPVVLGRGVVQLLTLVQQTFASLLAAGAVSFISFATRLSLLPVSLFGMSVAAASLPDLSEIGRGDAEALRRQVVPGLARIAFYVAPTVAAFVVIGDLLVATVYQSGEFTRVQTIAVWLTLLGANVGLMANTSARLLQSVLYGGGDTRRPAAYSVVRLVVALAIGGVLMLQLDQVVLSPQGVALAPGASLPTWSTVPAEAVAPGTFRLGAVGLTLGAGMSGWLEYALLRRRVRVLSGLDARVGGGTLRQVVPAALVMGAVGLALRPAVADLPPLLEGPVAAIPMGIVYVATALRMGAVEARTMSQGVRRLTRLKR